MSDTLYIHTLTLQRMIVSIVYVLGTLQNTGFEDPLNISFPEKGFNPDDELSNYIR